MKNFSGKIQKLHRNAYGKSLKHSNGFLKKRFSKFSAQQFVFRWIGLCILAISLIGYGLIRKYVINSDKALSNGGTLYVGISDQNNKMNFNPFFLNSTVEIATGKMIYSTVLKYDANGKLVSDLANSWKYSEDGKSLEIILKSNLKWHDTSPLTADDIIYTFQTIQNPDMKNANLDAFKGLTFEKVDDLHLIIKSQESAINLGDVLTQVPIAPKHILAGYSASVMRSIKYNQQPIGSGEFYFTNLSTGSDGNSSIVLKPNSYYYLTGSTLDNLVVRVYQSDDDLAQALVDKEVLLSVTRTNTKVTNILNLHVQGGVFLFFNNSRAPFNDTKIRNALGRVILPGNLSLEYNSLISPLVEVNPSIPLATMSIDECRETMKANGYTINTQNMLEKDGKNLNIGIYTGSSEIYKNIVNSIAQQWRGCGVDVAINVLENADLSVNYISPKSYDALVYAISLSSISDPYSYWASSNAVNNTLNLSNYASKTADVELDIARTKVDPAKRNERLQRFADIFAKDLPAVPLYKSQLSVNYNKELGVSDLKDVVLLEDASDVYHFLGQVKVQRRDALENP